MRGGALPTGTVTFFLTDIEGSTKLWEQHPDVMGASVERQVELIQSAVAENGGVLVKSKGEGDSTFSVFERASGAVAAAADAQRALRSEAWPAGIALRTRAAIHTCEAELRDGDYYGSEVNRCARLRSVAHGGQTLVSRSTADMTSAPPDTSFRDLGMHGLRDLAKPEHVYQLCIEGLTNEFPRLRSLEAFRQNLPSQRTSFIGRDAEVSRVREYLAELRLVTLTGVGGCGKTRLSLQVAVEELENFPGGIYFVDLARVTDPDAVMSAAASALDISGAAIGTPAAPVQDEIVRALSQDRTLIVLDNCEHLVDACAELADTLLEACPDLRILATSREALEVDGEQSFSVPSLDTASSAVDLFCDRAVGVRPDFGLSDQNRESITEICRRLDGMPLAIELAAAQVTHLAPARIAERLNDRFRLLTGGRRRVQRQQTLGAALDWSHDLLSDDERQLLRRLSVFPGTFNIEAAEVVGGSDLAVPVIGTLRSLVNKSLVDARDEDGDVRYRMLETVRLYAEEKLLVAEESEHVRRCHAEHYAGQVNFNWLAEVLQYGKAALVLREAHNIRAAIAWFHGADEPERFAKVVLAAVPLWAASFEEGARWIDAALASRDRLEHDMLGSLMAARCWVAGHRQEWPKAIRIAQAIVEHARDATEPTS